MRRPATSRSSLVLALALAAVLSSPAAARAELILRDQGGWTFYTTGLVGAHFQFIKGDADPITTNLLVGGKIRNNSSQDEQNKLATSRIRSGFVGTQIGFGVGHKISETLRAKTFVAVSLNGVDSSRGTAGVKDVDFREAWGALIGPFGTIAFGRMFRIFGSASGEVVSYAYGYGTGHPCYADQSGIACGSVGAGPLYAGYDAQLRYHTPRFAGLEVQVAMADPAELPAYHITPLPRFDGEINGEYDFMADGKVVVKGQGFQQKVARLNADRDGIEAVNAWGVMGAMRVEVAGFKAGGGYWSGKGIGTHMALQADNLANPLAHDIPGGSHAGGELRLFRGMFGNLVYDYHGTALALGGGLVQVRQTLSDADAGSNVSLVKQNTEFHAVLTQRIDNVILTAEFMHWKTEWHRGETQSLNFVGAGASAVW